MFQSSVSTVKNFFRLWLCTESQVVFTVYLLQLKTLNIQTGVSDVHVSQLKTPEQQDIHIHSYLHWCSRPLFSFYLFILIDLVEKKNGSAWCNYHSLKEVYTRFILSDLRENKFCYRTSGIMTSGVGSDVTHPLCVLFYSLVFTGRSGHVIMLMNANLLFFLPLRTLGPLPTRCSQPIAANGHRSNDNTAC